MEKENINIRRSWSTPALLPGTDEPEKIPHQPKDIKFCTTAQGESSNKNALAGPSDQPRMTRQDRETNEFHGLFLSQKYLQLLVATELRNLNRFKLNCVMMRGVEETPVEVIGIKFNNANTAMKGEFFRFLKTELTDMSHHELMDKLIHKCFECCTQSEVFVNKLAKEVFKNPKLTERILKVSNFNVIKERMVEKDNNVTLKVQEDLPSITFEDESAVIRKHILLKLGKTKVVRAPQQNLEKMKKRSSSTFPTQ